MYVYSLRKTFSEEPVVEENVECEDEEDEGKLGVEWPGRARSFQTSQKDMHGDARSILHV